MRTSVVLRPLELADVADVFRAVRESRAELGRWMPWCTPDYNQARAAEDVVKSQAERKAGLAFVCKYTVPVSGKRNIASVS